MNVESWRQEECRFSSRVHLLASPGKRSVKLGALEATNKEVVQDQVMHSRSCQH